MAEYWDLYDEDRQLTGETHRRGLPVPEGRYHLVTDIWTFNQEGKVLIDQRHPDKPNGLEWECTGGSAITGESSIEAAIREYGEELGLKVTQDELRLIHSTKAKDRFVDTYVTIQDVTEQDLTLQEIEVVDAKFISFDELVKLWEQGIVSPKTRFPIYRDILEDIVHTLTAK